MGQLLVVARHTDTSPSSCYEPELFSGPLATGIGITVNGPGNCSLVYIISGVRHMQPRCEEYGPGNLQAASFKQQASSLTVIVGYGRIKSPLATGIGITANGQKQKGKQ